MKWILHVFLLKNTLPSSVSCKLSPLDELLWMMFHSRKWRVSVRPPQYCLTNGQESLMGVSHARPLNKKEGNSPKCAINFRKGGKQLTNTYLKHDLMPLLKFAKFHWLHVSYQINVVNSANHHYIMIFIVPWCQSCWNLVYQSQISLLFSPQVIHKLPQYPVSCDYRSLRNWPCCRALISLFWLRFGCPPVTWENAFTFSEF